MTQKVLGGASNKKSRQSEAVKEAMLEAFVALGGTPALVAWGAENPSEFYKLWARILPHEVRENIADKKRPDKKRDTVSIEFVQKPNGATGARVVIGEALPPVYEDSAGEDSAGVSVEPLKLPAPADIPLSSTIPAPIEINAQPEDSRLVSIPVRTAGEV